MSPLSSFIEGSFEEILDDISQPHSATKLVLCSGHFYYDLLSSRLKEKMEQEVALIRIEQLYPLNRDKLKRIISSYPSVSNIIWAQEEPSNMGAYRYIAPYIQDLCGKSQLDFVARETSASPATGSHKRHDSELKTLIKQVFGK